MNDEQSHGVTYNSDVAVTLPPLRCFAAMPYAAMIRATPAARYSCRYAFRRQMPALSCHYFMLRADICCHAIAYAIAFAAAACHTLITLSPHLIYNTTTHTHTIQTEHRPNIPSHQ